MADVISAKGFINSERPPFASKSKIDKIVVPEPTALSNSTLEGK